MGESKLQFADRLVGYYKRVVEAEMPSRVFQIPERGSGKARPANGVRDEWGLHPTVIFAVEGSLVLRFEGRDSVQLRIGDAIFLHARDLLDLRSGGQGIIVGIETIGTQPGRCYTADASDPCVLRTKKGAAGLLLDFGRELHGGVQIMGWHSKGNNNALMGCNG